MMTPADPLLQRLLAARDFTVELAPAGPAGPARSVTLRRPPESQILQMGASGVTHADVCTTAVAWSGFTEATLFGAAVGSNAAVDFTPERWAAWVQDHADEMSLCLARLVEAISAHIEQRAADRKN